MNYYHLVTRKPMYIGQKIIFDKRNKNRLYSFFLDNNFKYKSNESLDQIIQRLDTNLNNEDLSFLNNSMSHTSRAIREVVTEMIRLESFPMLPSRFECLYGADNLDDLIAWKELFESYNRVILQIVKLENTGPVFKGNASLLPDLENNSFLEKIDQAKEYWSSPTDSHLSEVLIGGEITVTEIVEDFQ